MKTSDFVAFKQLPPDGRRTGHWAVVNTMTSEEIGRVSWLGRWRCYCFFPHDSTVLDPDCLFTIAEFVERKIKERRNQSTGDSDERVHHGESGVRDV